MSAASCPPRSSPYFFTTPTTKAEARWRCCQASTRSSTRTTVWCPTAKEFNQARVPVEGVDGYPADLALLRTPAVNPPTPEVRHAVRLHPRTTPGAPAAVAASRALGPRPCAPSPPVLLGVRRARTTDRGRLRDRACHRRTGAVAEPGPPHRLL